MRYKTPALAWAAFLVAAAAGAQQPGPTTPGLSPLTLTEAVSLSEASNPALRSKQAELAAAEGLKAEAEALLFNNPEVTAAQTRRSAAAPSGSERWNEWNAGLSQKLELAGQQGYRREVAAARLDAMRFEIASLRRQVAAGVAERFYRVLALQQRVDLEAQAAKLFDDTATAIQKRRAAGEDTRLDANVALVEAERARNQLAIAEEQLLDARNALATELQLPPSGLPRAVGDLATRNRRYSLEELLALADAQPKLRALAARENSAGARLELERAAVYPDVTLGVFAGREGLGAARENLTTFTVSLPLPLFNRNDAGIGQARTALNQTQIERQAAARDARASVNVLWARLASLESRVRRLQESVLPALADNQQLLLKSQRAGQIGLLELIVVNRQALDAQRDLIDALIDYYGTRAALELAAGWPAEGNQP